MFRILKVIIKIWLLTAIQQCCAIYEEINATFAAVGVGGQEMSEIEVSE